MSATKTTLRLAKSVAHEDLRVGDYVTFLQVSYQYPSFLWSDGAQPRGEPVQMTFLPMRAGVPLKIKAICLPFLVVKGPNERPNTIDVRQCRLARLDERYAKVAWKAMRKKKKHGRKE